MILYKITTKNSCLIVLPCVVCGALCGCVCLKENFLTAKGVEMPFSTAYRIAKFFFPPRRYVHAMPSHTRNHALPYWTYFMSLQNLQWARDVLLGSSVPWQQLKHMPAQGLFCERNKTNLFNVSNTNLPIPKVDQRDDGHCV